MFSCFLFFSVAGIEAGEFCWLRLSELQAQKPSDYVAAIVLAEKHDQVLLGLRRSTKGNEVNTWAMAGGKMEPSDTDLIGAAQREFFEETGLWIRRDRFEFFFVLDYQGQDGKLYQSFFFRLVLNDHEEAIVPEAEKDKTAVWRLFPHNQLPANLFSTNQQVISLRFGSKSGGGE